MIEDFRLKVFETVAETANFTAAARELGITQPAVSQNIGELEKALGVSLFTRTRNSVELSPEGARFREYALQIIHWYEAANQAFDPDTPRPAEVELANGRVIQVWSSGNDIHLKLKDE